MARNTKMPAGKATSHAKNRVSESTSLDTLRLDPDVEGFTIKEGKMLFDILAYEVTTDHHPEEGIEKGMLWYQRIYWRHRKIGPAGVDIVCPARTFNKRCPICEEIRSLEKDEDADEAYIKELRPKQRELFNVRDPQEPDKRYVLDMSPYCFGELLDQELADEDNEADGFANIEDGLTVGARFNKEDGLYKFLKIGSIKFVKRKVKYDLKDLDSMVDLDKALKVLSFAEIDELHAGTMEDEDSGDDSSDDSSDTPAPRQRERGSVDSEDEPESEEQESAEDTSEDTENKDGLEVPEGRELCDTCDGAKVNVRGKPCKICDGEGHVAEGPF